MFPENSICLKYHKINWNFFTDVHIYKIFPQFLLRLRNISEERNRQTLYTHFRPKTLFTHLCR